MVRHHVKIVSDVMCPWCWVGKRNLEAAVSQAGLSMDDIKVEWRPFLLRPEMPEEGVPKAGTEFERVSESMLKTGRAAGIEFTGLTDRYPRTVKAHTLLKFALEEEAKSPDNAGLQHKLAEVLFRQYFTDGLFVGDSAVLQAAAEEVGLDVEKATAFMEDDGNQSAVFDEAAAYRQRGVSGVPTFWFDGVRGFSGGQPPARFLHFLQAASDSDSKASKQTSS